MRVFLSITWYKAGEAWTRSWGSPFYWKSWAVRDFLPFHIFLFFAFRTKFHITKNSRSVAYSIKSAALRIDGQRTKAHQNLVKVRFIHILSYILKVEKISVRNKQCRACIKSPKLKEIKGLGCVAISNIEKGSLI